MTGNVGSQAITPPKFPKYLPNQGGKRWRFELQSDGATVRDRIAVQLKGASAT